MSSYRDFDTDKAWDYLRVPLGCTQLQFTALSPGSAMLELTVLPGWPQIVCFPSAACCQEPPS